MRQTALFILFIFPLHFVFAQSQQAYSSAEIFQEIKKLNVLGSVLYIGAHPDDENNSLLPYLAKEKLYRTAYLSLTRGDGGQNLIGDEQGVELGLIRTQELLAARKIDGAEQYFTRAYEFGYSKSATEALRIWDKEKILSDVVWVIRKFQPDILIKRFPGDERAGHGHHAASALLADEAFIAAADPSRFPEQMKYGVKAWQAKRILWNTYRFGSFNTTSEDQLKIEIGGYNALIGKSYGELGGEARTMHKSQGEGRPNRKGSSIEYFLNTNGPAPADDLMDGVDTSWSRLNGGELISQSVKKILADYQISKPSASVPLLIDLYKAISSLPVDAWTSQKKEELQQIIVHSSGLFIEATSSQPQVVAGDSLAIEFFINQRENVNASIENISVSPFDTILNFHLPANENFVLNKVIYVPAGKDFSQPYWLKHPLQGGNFQVDDQQLIGKAENDPAFEVTFKVTIHGQQFDITRPVQYRYIDAVKGDTYQPIAVLPNTEVRYAKDNYVSINNSPVLVSVNVKSNDSKSLMNSVLSQKLSPEWTQKEQLVKQVSIPSNEMNLQATLKPLNSKENITEQIEASVAQNGKVFDHYTKTIAYDHIPVITYFPLASSNLLKLDINIEGKNIGYFNGAGDRVTQAMEELGYHVTYLGEADLTIERLKQFDAIVTGIRAYNIHEYLTNKNDVLNEFIKSGGNLIVQYIKSNLVGSQEIKAGPFPFTVNSRSRVTEENAGVKFLIPAHPVFNYPNKITVADFNNWIQERSTYQAIEFDEHFVTPLAMHDTDEEESKGSLAIAKYGKGNMVYASLVFFRQLPAGVPGAYRLLANLLALPQNK